MYTVLTRANRIKGGIIECDIVNGEIDDSLASEAKRRRIAQRQRAHRKTVDFTKIHKESVVFFRLFRPLRNL